MIFIWNVKYISYTNIGNNHTHKQSKSGLFVSRTRDLNELESMCEFRSATGTLMSWISIETAEYLGMVSNEEEFNLSCVSSQIG